MTPSIGRAAGASLLTVVEHDASLAAEDGMSAAGPHDASRPGGTRRLCAWCQGPIPERARRDAICCSVRCRQARHRFLRATGRAGPVAAGRPLRLACADPPYPVRPGCTGATRTTPGKAGHAALPRRLAGYNGPALSTSAEALPGVLALCPPGVRVAAWHRGERPTASRWPLQAWEPVIYAGGRQIIRDRLQPRRADSIVCGVAPVTTLPGRVIGA